MSNEFTKEQEQEIREIIRDELKHALRAVGEKAKQMSGYGAGELDEAFLKLLKDVMEASSDDLPHDWGCDIHSPFPMRPCTCRRKDIPDD